MCLKRNRFRINVIVISKITSITLQSRSAKYHPFTMKKTLLTLLVAITTQTLIATSAFAATKPATAKFTGTDYSGVYSCAGNNAKIGNYNLLVTFAINKAYSHRNLGRYDLTIETENSTTYGGQAMVNGNDMALTIEIVDGNAVIFSTGIARFKSLKNKRFSYSNYYYESNQITNTGETKAEPKNTGNDGSENCVMQKPKVKPKKA